MLEHIQPIHEHQEVHCITNRNQETLNVTYMGPHVRAVTETYYMLGKYAVPTVSAHM